MQIMKCDRCGAYYEKNTERILPVTERERLQFDEARQVRQFKSIEMVPVTQIGLHSRGHYKAIDLCDDCAKKLMKFIKNEEDI